jgi:hypothetical protein
MKFFKVHLSRGAAYRALQDYAGTGAADHWTFFARPGMAGVSLQNR